VQVGKDSNWASVTAGYDHTCGLRTDGTAWCWGYNRQGGLGVGDVLRRLRPEQVGVDTNWATLSGGRYHTCAVRTRGVAWCWGDDIEGQLGDGHMGGFEVAPVRVART
jgi:alpha-tubulin suppressor-like RCC1 family protein